jgi:hypothetical protein
MHWKLHVPFSTICQISTEGVRKTHARGLRSNNCNRHNKQTSKQCQGSKQKSGSLGAKKIALSYPNTSNTLVEKHPRGFSSTVPRLVVEILYVFLVFVCLLGRERFTMVPLFTVQPGCERVGILSQPERYSDSCVDCLSLAGGGVPCTLASVASKAISLPHPGVLW